VTLAPVGAANAVAVTFAVFGVHAASVVARVQAITFVGAFVAVAIIVAAAIVVVVGMYVAVVAVVIYVAVVVVVIYVAVVAVVIYVAGGQFIIFNVMFAAVVMLLFVRWAAISIAAGGKCQHHSKREDKYNNIFHIYFLLIQLKT